MRRALVPVLAAVLLPLPACLPLGDDALTVTVQLEDTAGLFVGNDVGVLGVSVGEITDIEPAGSHVKVTLSIDADVPVPADAGAVVVARSVATDRYLELTPRYESGPRMADDAVIPMERTKTPAEFDDVLASLDELSTGLSGPDGDGKGLRRMLSAAADTLDGRGAELNQTVTALADASQGLAGNSDEIASTIGSLDRLTGLLAEDREAVDQLLVSMTDATDMFSDERHRFGKALTSLSRALRSLARFVAENRSELRGSLKGLTTVTDNLLRHQGELAEVMEVGPLTLGNIGDAIGKDDRLHVKLPLQHLSPAREVTDEICAALPFVCEELGVAPSLPDLIRNLIGAAQP